MEKFQTKYHGNLIKKMPFSYFSTNVYLDFCAYVFPRNGESIVISQDVVYPHDFPSIFPPKQKKNWERCSVMFADDAYLDAIKKESIKIIAKNPTVTEFYFKTEQFIHPHGEMERDVKLFQRRYPNHRITHTCDPKLIRKFYKEWKQQKKRDNIVFNEAEQFFDFCLDHLKQYKIRQVYVFDGKKLIGLAWGVLHSHGKWVGLHLKSLYAYKGLGRFLHHERAKLFSDVPLLTLGTEAHEKGIGQFKEGLHPVKKVAYQYVLTGDRQKK